MSATARRRMQTTIASASSSELPSSARSSETEMIGNSSTRMQAMPSVARLERRGTARKAATTIASQTALSSSSIISLARQPRSGRLPHSMTSWTADGFNQQRTDLIRVHVRGGTAVFEVSESLVGRGHRDAHRGAAVADAVAEGVHRRRLVQPGQALLVVRAGNVDVGLVAA